MRSQLRIVDLKRRDPAPARLMSIKVPARIAGAIDRLARDLGASKTDVVVALLNEGLEAATKKIERRARYWRQRRISRGGDPPISDLSILTGRRSG